MSDRLTKIYTRTGDAGDTGMADGSRIAKDDLLMHVQGEVDELNSVLGVLASKLTSELVSKQKESIRQVQHTLFDIGGEISMQTAVLTQDKVVWLEQQIDEFNSGLEPLKEFILPGGNESGALCHLARTVCRRVERNMVSLDRVRKMNPATLAFINRLSDYLFVFSRVLNGGDEIYWQSERLKSE